MGFGILGRVGISGDQVLAMPFDAALRRAYEPQHFERLRASIGTF